MVFYVFLQKKNKVKMGEYLKLKGNEHLINKRARFKDELQGYTPDLWLKTGVIKQLYQCQEGDLNHIGLSLVFDDKTFRMSSCYIMPGSIELI